MKRKLKMMLLGEVRRGGGINPNHIKEQFGHM
jgi:hypothetical protein